MIAPITIYLDSSDYSRFGKVEQGDGDPSVAEIYEQLKVARAEGIARFAYSMPILSELLQYHADFAETSLAKARAVEALCGRNAFIWPMRLVALDLARAAHDIGLLPEAPTCLAVSPSSEWFPSVAGSFESLKERLREGVENALAQINTHNRAERRKVESRIKKLNHTKLAAEAAPELADLYGLRLADVRNAILPVLDGRLSPDEGARKLFSAIGEPTAFIQTYFVRYKGEKDLPSWMSDTGKRIQQTLLDTRARVRALNLKAMRPKETRARLAPMMTKMTSRLVSLTKDSALEFNVPDDVIELFANEPSLAAKLQSVDVFTKVTLDFFIKNGGFEGDGHKPEDSAAGDLFHSLYLPHCDLWRADRRFGHVVRGAVPSLASRVVTKLEDLPEMLSAKHASLRI